MVRQMFFFFFSSRRRHTRCSRDWSSDVCSSDLYAGIITLGHSAFFGLGAYVAGIVSAKVGITDAFVQMAAAAAAAGLLGALTGAVILRTRALTLLMLTLAITSIILEIANKATWLTGGADGLSGVVRSEEHTSELQSRLHLVCRLLLEKKKNKQ